MSDQDPSRHAEYEPSRPPEYDPHGGDMPPGSTPADAPPALPREKEDRLWAMAAHMSGPASVLLSVGYLPFLGPLIVWLVKKDENAFVGDQAKEALNFQITIFAVNMIGLLISLVTCGLGFLIYLPFAIVVAVASFVLGILAGIQAYDGKPYRYPYTWRPL